VLGGKPEEWDDGIMEYWDEGDERLKLNSKFKMQSAK
jgi:hypothetical protein